MEKRIKPKADPFSHLVIMLSFFCVICTIGFLTILYECPSCMKECIERITDRDKQDHRDKVSRSPIKDQEQYYYTPEPGIGFFPGFFNHQLQNFRISPGRKFIKEKNGKAGIHKNGQADCVQCKVKGGYHLNEIVQKHIKSNHTENDQGGQIAKVIIQCRIKSQTLFE